VTRLMRTVVGMVGLGIWATGAIVVASVQVARDIIAPSARLVPGVVIVPLHLQTPTQLAVWASLVNLTPGTLIVGIADDLDEAWVHSLYAADPAALKVGLIDEQERVLRAFGDDAAREVS
jgi:multicomponent Na+:H+ antiporter subunit E